MTKDVFVYDGESFDLPKKTMAVAQIIDAAHKAKTSAESYKNQYKLVTMCLPADKAAEFMDGKTLNEIDLVTLSVLFNGIEDAYARRTDEQAKEREMTLLNRPALETITAVGASAKNIRELAISNA